MPEFVEPPMLLPKWAAPCELLPVGFLRGTAPVLIMDVSGTMHPARRGQFLRVKKCVCQLLEPTGGCCGCCPARRGVDEARYS
jgi:hypothetical protein